MWRRALRVYLVGLGIAMVLIGAIVFFAFNWADSHRLGKLAFVASGLVASASHAASQGLDAIRGKSAILVATVLAGPFGVVFGQAYQAGADPWNLFALWAALTLLWVVGARFVGLWMLWLCIAVAALLLFWKQRHALCERGTYDPRKCGVNTLMGPYGSVPSPHRASVLGRGRGSHGGVRCVGVVGLESKGQANA